MKTVRKILLILVPLMGFVMTSCIEITQEIKVNNDKSGTYTLKIDLGLLNYASSDVKDAMGFISGLKEMPAKAVEKLKTSSGIHSVENISNDGNGIFGFMFSFEDDKSLNNALYGLADQQKFFLMPDYIKIKRHKIKVTDLAPYIKKANSVSKQGENQMSSFMNEQFSDHIFFNTILNLPSAVKRTNNPRSEIQGNIVKLRSSMSELVKGTDYGNIVKY